MSELDEIKKSYVEANAARLAGIKSQAEGLFRTDSLTVECDVDANEVVNAENLLTVDRLRDDIQDDQIGTVDLVEMTVTENRQSMETATARSLGLYARASMRFIDTLSEEQIEALKESRETVRPKHGTAVHRVVPFEHDGKRITVESTTFAEFENFGSVDEVNIRIEDDLLEQNLTLISHGGEVTDVIENTQPVYDELLVHAGQLLDSDGQTEIWNKLLVGRLSSDEAVAESLKFIETHAKEDVTTEELHVLLGQLKDRAYMVGEAWEMKKMFGPDMPAADVLDEFEAVLVGLSEA